MITSRDYSSERQEYQGESVPAEPRGSINDRSTTSAGVVLLFGCPIRVSSLGERGFSEIPSGLALRGIDRARILGPRRPEFLENLPLGERDDPRRFVMGQGIWVNLVTFVSCGVHHTDTPSACRIHSGTTIGAPILGQALE
jgi:hypothetical protein